MTRKTPPSNVYTKDYLLSHSAGFKEFSEGKISPKHEKAIQYLEPRPNERILDVGCGRGEVVEGCARMGASVIGCDYSSDALEITRNYTTNGDIIRADASHFPFRDDVFDKVALLDIIEHLDQKDLEKCLAEAHRVLKKDGRVVISTPNRWRYLYRLIGSAYGWLAFWRENIQQEKNESWHINEQSSSSLKRTLSRYNFRPKVLFDTEVPLYIKRLRVIPLKILLAAAYKLLFPITGELWCIAVKK